MTDKVIPIRVAGREPLPQTPWDGAPPRDAFARPLRDLRISVTDRCNFRCVYCMPREVFGADYRFLPHASILTFEEIARLARIFVGMGVRKIRLTGGEPLVRKDVEKLVALLAPLGTDLTLTTNGSALARLAGRLKNAGLQRVTVSLDGLDDATFRRMNDTDVPVARVIEGIEAAAAVGLAPVKINMVVKRGVNDQQILDMARRWRGSGHVLRFIEYMDVGSTNGWRMDDVVPSAEIIRRIDAEFPLEPADRDHPGEVAERWRYRDGAGEIGVISSVTQAFCRDCSRMRLSTEGKLFTCLFGQSGHDVMSLVRGGVADDVLRDAIASVWLLRSDRYSELRTAETAQRHKVEMSYIGG